jgi:hypothetical protein
MLVFDYPGLVVSSTASITDLPAFHAALRDAEDSELGMLYPVTHTWKALALGGGASFYQADLVNGWQLKFPTAGSYTITGNLNGTIIPVAGVYVERQTSAAFVTTAVGGSGPTAADIAAAVWQRAIESGLTAEQMLRIMLAPLAGKATGVGTGAEIYLAQDGLTARVTASFDASGNRASVAVDGA